MIRRYERMQDDVFLRLSNHGNSAEARDQI